MDSIERRSCRTQKIDSKHRGIIPVMWFIIFLGKTLAATLLHYQLIVLEYYFILKYPRFIVVALLSIVTHVLIIGCVLET